MKKFIFCILLVLLVFINKPVFAGSEDEVKHRLMIINNTTNWTTAYELSVWDCSNMARCLSQVFFDYETRIVEGQQILAMPIELSNGNLITHLSHVKLKILIGDRWYWIEPTTLILGDVLDKSFSKDREFKNYQEAMKYRSFLYGEQKAFEVYGINKKYAKEKVLMHSDTRNILISLRICATIIGRPDIISYNTITKNVVFAGKNLTIDDIEKMGGKIVNGRTLLPIQKINALLKDI